MGKWARFKKSMGSREGNLNIYKKKRESLCALASLYPLSIRSNPARQIVFLFLLSQCYFFKRDSVAKIVSRVKVEGKYLAFNNIQCFEF